MQKSYGSKKQTTSPSCNFQWVQMLQTEWKIWKCCETLVFWKITDGTMCKSLRVAIGAGTFLFFGAYEITQLEGYV